MKKIILSFLILSAMLSAYQINKKVREGKNEIIYHIKCNDGSLEMVTENISINEFFPGATSSLNKAVKNVCSNNTAKKNTNKIKIKSEAIFFYKRNGNSGILSSLTNEVSYTSTRTMCRMTDKYGFLIASNATVTKLKYYAPHKVKTDKYGNFKKNGKYTIKLIDGYYKVRDNKGKIYFVRQNERI